MYLDAFVLACNGILRLSGAAYLNSAMNKKAQQHRDARTADVVIPGGAWSHGCLHSLKPQPPHGEIMGHDSSSTPWRVLSGHALCL